MSKHSSNYINYLARLFVGTYYQSILLRQNIDFIVPREGKKQTQNLAIDLSLVRLPEILI